MRIGRLPALLLCMTALPASAADWLTVAADRIRRVELDMASVTQTDAGVKSAWGRVVLNDSQAAIVGYKDVRALNRYDCRTRSFVIVKRAYLSHEGRTLREEEADSTRPIAVKTGTVDERFFNEICKPPTARQLQQVAREAERQVKKATGTADADSGVAARRANIAVTPEEPPAKPARPERPPRAEADKEAGPKPRYDERPPRPAPRDTPVDKPVDKTDAAQRPASREKPLKPAPTPAQAPKPTTESPPASPPPGKALVAKPSPSEPAGAVALTAVRDGKPAAGPAPAPVTALSPPALAAWARTPAPTPPPPVAARAESKLWGYEGETGPDHWARLNPEFATCEKGRRQSPIDLRDGIRVDQEALRIDYKASYFRIIDNGRTVRVTYGPGSMLSVMGRTFELKHVDFRMPSEERIDGRVFPMSAQLFHQDAEGRVAMLAVLIERGEPNKLVQTLWNHLPLEKHEEYQAPVSIHMSELLPAQREYYSYMGSLTTPPCTEGVLWLVLREPVTLSPDQIAVFAHFYPNNTRPVQAINGRTIKAPR